jgi:ABC-type lipoprotein export system ATPase subunit
VDGPVLALREVRVDYRTAAGAVTAVRDISFEVPGSGLTVLAGPSGSGKSTLIRLLGLLERPTAGSVELDGVPVSRRGHRELRRLRRSGVATVFQSPADNLLSRLSVAGNLRAAAQAAGRPDPGEPLLCRLGLAGTGSWRTTALSGGQQQRLAFACALARGAEVILADEPTSQLDTASADLVLDTLRSLVADAVPVVVSSHDPRLVLLGDVVVRLAGGSVTGIAEGTG